MIRRKLMRTVLGASLLATGGFAISGCAGDEGQPDRGTISAPRKGGGLEDKGGENVKGNSATEKTKIGGKSGDL